MRVLSRSIGCSNSELANPDVAPVAREAQVGTWAFGLVLRFTFEGGGWNDAVVASFMPGGKGSGWERWPLMVTRLNRSTGRKEQLVKSGLAGDSSDEGAQ